ncbi:hypothetical protein [Streptomyces avermitilis]|uniref:hypothetical protein n=1 Tax=Streptomyces avermitilis TaxID=33903 RepID=UPI000A636822|nr:hypothetical protein [Streptomyces avermitilis]
MAGHPASTRSGTLQRLAQYARPQRGQRPPVAGSGQLSALAASTATDLHLVHGVQH